MWIQNFGNFENDMQVHGNISPEIVIAKEKSSFNQSW